MRVLVVEDDEVISAQLVKALEKEGHYGVPAYTGTDGWNEAALNSYSLIILDLMLPDMDGIEVCRKLRKADVATPVLMLTARDAVEDRVTGLDVGADDYLVKPFALEEFLARVRALLRRESRKKSAVLKVADLIVDTRSHSAQRGDRKLNLTRREFDLLEALVRNREQVLTREAILERVWNADEALPNTVNFHVSSLRKKVDPPGSVPLIHTEHGLGYVLRTP